MLLSLPLPCRDAGQRPDCMAEREGFEPSIRGYRIHTFQACSFNHSDTSPGRQARKGKPESGALQMTVIPCLLTDQWMVKSKGLGPL